MEEQISLRKLSIILAGKKAFDGYGPNKQDNMLTDAFFIPNETVPVNDRDPRWINKIIKCLIQDKNLVYKKHLKEK